MENVGKPKKVLGIKEVKKASGKDKQSDEKILEMHKGGETVKIEAFPRSERPPALPYDVLKYPNKIKILDARTVETRYGVRKLVEIELLKTESTTVSPGKYTLWCSRLGLQRVFEQLGDIYNDPRGLVIELRETGKVGRAINYILTVLREG